jgi:hypothetical protein
LSATLEFHSIELAQWLHCQHLSFVLRQKCSTTFREKRKPFQSLDSIPVQPGIHLFYPRVGFTQKKGFSRFNLVASWKRKYRGKEEDEPWYLLTNLPDLKSAIGVYGQRYGIEAMFKDCKTGGYNLEGCQASPDKLIAKHDFNWVHLTFANTSSGKLTIEISTAQRKDRGNTLDIPLRSR